MCCSEIDKDVNERRGFGLREDAGLEDDVGFGEEGEGEGERRRGAAASSRRSSAIRGKGGRTWRTEGWPDAASDDAVKDEEEDGKGRHVRRGLAVQEELIMQQVAPLQQAPGMVLLCE